MSKQHNAFTKKHEEALAQDKNAILEELNLPPVLVTFLRKNARSIKIAVIAFIIGVVAWEGYGEYRHRQQENSAALLYSSIKADSNEQKIELLSKVEHDFRSSDSALWAKIEKGHLAFKNKEYQEAVTKYNEVIGKISTSDSLYPLVLFSIAQAHDSMNDTAKAEGSFRKLLDYPGFASEGYLGLGRLYEKNGENAKALEMYESYITLPDIMEGSTKDLIQFKIVTLKEIK